MKYCCLVWAGAAICFLKSLNKVQKRTSSLAPSLEPLAHLRYVESLSLYLGITLVDVHLNWLIWFHVLILEGGLLVILIEYIFSVTIPRCYKDVHVNSSFPSTARHWHSLPKEWFPFAYDLICLKSRIN